METQTKKASRDAPWNKGKLVEQKAPLRLNEIWAIRVRLQLSHRVRELALFNLAIDSKLRACDLVKLRMQDDRTSRHGSTRGSSTVGWQTSVSTRAATAHIRCDGRNPR